MVNDNGLLLMIGACVTYLLKLKYKQPEYNQQQQKLKGFANTCVYTCMTNMQEFHKKQTCNWCRKLNIVIYSQV